MTFPEKTTRWTAYFLLVVGLGTAHYFTASAGELAKPPAWWWLLVSTSKQLTLTLFNDVLGFSEQDTIRTWWPLIGFAYYATLLVPIFSAPFSRPRRDWTLAIILLSTHFFLSGALWLLESGALVDILVHI